MKEKSEAVAITFLAMLGLLLLAQQLVSLASRTPAAL